MVRYSRYLFYLAIGTLGFLSCKSYKQEMEINEELNCIDKLIPIGEEPLYADWKVYYEKYCDEKYNYFTKTYFDSILLENQNKKIFNCFYKDMPVEEFDLVLFKLQEFYDIKRVFNFCFDGDISYVYPLTYEYGKNGSTETQYFRIDALANLDTIESIVLSNKTIAENSFVKILDLFKKKYKKPYYSDANTNYYKWLLDNRQIRIYYNANHFIKDNVKPEGGFETHELKIYYDNYSDSLPSHDLKYLLKKYYKPEKQDFSKQI